MITYTYISNIGLFPLIFCQQEMLQVQNLQSPQQPLLLSETELDVFCTWRSSDASGDEVCALDARMGLEIQGQVRAGSEGRSRK